MKDGNLKNIVIIDYGAGNLQSVLTKFRRLKIDSSISSRTDEIAKADKLIFPGVGHFANAVKNLDKSGIIDILNKKVLEEKTPVLGICLGMQLFSKFSEEGDVGGLGWINASTKKFRPEDSGKLKIPHMGWNSLSYRKDSLLFENVDIDALFYFAHSYYVDFKNYDEVLTETNYIIDFVSAFNQENIYGLQFHPEKSHDAGFQIIKNFCNL